MIYVNQKQLDQVEYLIEQSARGHHILFDTETIRRVFRAAFVDRSHRTVSKVPKASEAFKNSKTSKTSKEEILQQDGVEQHIEALILQPTLIAKKAYLENLHPKTYDRVVRTYFAIVENNILEDMKFSQ